MPLVVFAVVVVMLATPVPVFTPEKSTVAPVLRVMAPRVSVAF